MEQDTPRYFYVDWLRVVAFAILIAFHSAVAFFPDQKWLIESPQGSQLLSDIMDQPGAWRLALLFFISGMGTYFAFARKDEISFLKERLQRLLLPLLFSMCVLLVPQVWYERRYEEGYDGSLLQFWVERYFTEGIYPVGNFTWAHMWFVGYLCVMTVGLLPFFVLAKSAYYEKIRAFVRFLLSTPAIYLLFLLPLFFNLALAPYFPRQTNALYNDESWFLTWASWFGIGYFFAKEHKVAIDYVIRMRWLSLTAGIALTVYMYLAAWTPVGTPIGSYDEMTPIFRYCLMMLAWVSILAMVGFFAVHCNRPSRFLAWANNGVFPVYIIHQTIVVAALYYLLPLQQGVWPTFAEVAVITLVGSVLFYELVRRLPPSLRPLVGLPVHEKSRTGTSNAPQGRPAV